MTPARSFSTDSTRWRRPRAGSLVALPLAALIAVSAAGVVVSPVAASSPPSYQALTPARVLDTRSSTGATGPLGPGASITVDVTGAGGVPDSGVAAVVLNVTAVEATQNTFVTVWPTGQPKPNTSNLNVQPGVDTPNSVIATVGADGTTQIANEFGNVHLIADVSGWFPTNSGYHALTPDRVLDTRADRAADGPVGAAGEITVDVTGVGGVPDAGVSAVVLNVTAVEATASTYVTVWPSGQAKPGTSNLNVRPGIDTPNLVIATVGSDGNVKLANQFGNVNLIADVSGWFATGSGYQALTPGRVLDTRSNVGATGPLGPEGSITVDVTGVAGVPAGGVAAVVLNVTAAESTESTYVTVWPSGHPKPGTSNLNVQPGVDTPNLIIATVATDGSITLGNQFGSTHLIADVAGYFPGTPSTPPPDPSDPGTLWASGNGSIYRYELANPAAGWQNRGNYGETFTVDAPRNELIDIDASPYEPAVVTTRDLDTHALHEQYQWPTDAWGVNDLTASTDGAYLAAVMEYGSLDTWLEVLRRGDRTVIDLGFDSLVTEVQFAPNGDLLILLDDTYEEIVPEWRAAIGRITRAQIDAGSALTITLVRAFSDAEGVPAGIRVASDGQISFGRAGALWVMDGAGEHQLTTGPDAIVTGIFSPDGSRIACVLPSLAAQYQRQYIIPNHRGAPLYLAPNDNAGDQYQLDDSNLVQSMVAWVP